MAENQIDRKQRQRIHLTAGVLFLLVALMFVSAAFLRFSA